MNDGELELALAAESPRVEWKASDRTTDVLDAVCALANDLEGSGAPGFVVLGMNPKGVLTGLGYADAASRDRAQQALASQLGSIKIMPNPSVDIHPRERDGVWFIVLQVAPYPVPPIVKVNQTAWVRVGTHVAAPTLRGDSGTGEDYLVCESRDVQQSGWPVWPGGSRRAGRAL